MYLILLVSPGMVLRCKCKAGVRAHTCNPSTVEAEEVVTSLVYLVRHQQQMCKGTFP
jgi:hypothetical protein